MSMSSAVRGHRASHFHGVPSVWRPTVRLNVERADTWRAGGIVPDEVEIAPTAPRGCRAVLRVIRSCGEALSTYTRTGVREQACEPGGAFQDEVCCREGYADGRVQHQERPTNAGTREAQLAG